jgi:hypothetical protein
MPGRTQSFCFPPEFLIVTQFERMTPIAELIRTHRFTQAIHDLFHPGRIGSETGDIRSRDPNRKSVRNVVQSVIS